MAKTRLVTTNLVRTLDRIASPVYLIDANSEITYANKACLEWLNVEAQELNGTLCRYTSQKLDEPMQNRIRGLTPPPDFFAASGDENAEQMFSVFVDHTLESKQYRTATASRLYDEEGAALALLVICSHMTTEHVEPIIESDLNARSSQLHVLLTSLRDQLSQKYKVPSVFGLGSTTLSLRKKIEVAIHSNAEVLIVGPSGSGREHLARTIDNQRRPHSNPPIPMHFAIADQELIQSLIKDLATNKSHAQTDDGKPECLLLLGVDQLSELGQAELWGFIRLPGFGSQIISTASQPLIELARDNKFHSGLAEFLGTLTLELLSLAKRAGDLPILAQSILEDTNTRRRKQISGFSAPAMQLIQQFDWPQNIDQLERCIQSAAEACSSNQISLEDFPESLRQANRALEIGRSHETHIHLESFLQEIEGELILRAMKQAKGNKSKAAKLLNVSRPKLLRRLQLLQVETDRESFEKDTEIVDSSAFEEAEDND